jgi:hypothetical protein
MNERACQFILDDRFKFEIAIDDRTMLPEGFERETFPIQRDDIVDKGALGNRSLNVIERVLLAN